MRAGKVFSMPVIVVWGLLVLLIWGATNLGAKPGEGVKLDKAILIAVGIIVVGLFVYPLFAPYVAQLMKFGSQLPGPK